MRHGIYDPMIMLLQLKLAGDVCLLTIAHLKYPYYTNGALVRLETGDITFKILLNSIMNVK